MVIIMNCKIKILSLLVMLSVLGVGCIDDTQTNYNLKYNFDKGDRFAYDLQSYSETPKNTRTSMHIEMVVLDIGSNLITMQTGSTATTNGNKTESSYRITMTDHGKLIELNSEDLIIPEIQPEIPNTIVYPEKQIQNGESWTITVKKTGNFTSSEMLTEYELSGTKNYACIGFKKITVETGNFDCVGIESDLNFTLSMITKTTNGTVYTTTTGEVSGEDWVDVKGGFLVKSEYNVDKVITTDLSEMYKEMGFEKFYRETPMNSHIISELISIHKAQ